MDSRRHELLKAAFPSSKAPLRPIMTSLNGDNSWLFSFPLPKEERNRLEKCFYHIVFEPWLSGPSDVLSSWLVRIVLPTPAAIANAAAVEELIRDIESVVGESYKLTPTINKPLDASKSVYTGGIDAIHLGFDFSDHLHEPTLRLFDTRIPVIATPKAADIVKGFGHFETIRLISNLPKTASTWRSPDLHPGHPLPSWITPLCMPSHSVLQFSQAPIWTHEDEEGKQVHEAILQTPHGTRLDEGPLDALLNAEPPTKKLVMLHPLKENYSGTVQAALGAKGGLALYRKLGGPKYWAETHNSMLSYEGIMMWLLRTKDIPRTLKWALEEEKKEKGNEAGHLPTPDVIQVANGASLVLS